MSTPERDDELEKFLAQRTVLPRALQEQENAEPSPELDRRVLERARAAVAPSTAREVMRRNRWFVPLTLAATIVLSFTIVLKIRQQSGDSPFTPMSARVITEPAGAQGETVPMEPPMRRIPERALSRDVAVPQLEPAPAPAADAAVADAAPLSDEIEGAPLEVEAAKERRLLASAERVAPMRSEAKAAAGASVANQARSDVAETPAASAPPAPPADTSVAKTESPQAWLERIAKLRAEGRHAQADREWRALRKRYPDFMTEHAAKE
jgi:hypothetical protein